MKPNSKMVLNISCYGLLSSLKVKKFLGVSISKERNLVVAERFLAKFVIEYDKYPVSTDRVLGIHKLVIFLKLKHHLQPSYEKRIIEGDIQNINVKLNVLMIIFQIEERNAN